MEPFTAINTLHAIFNFLDRNDITLSEIIDYGVQFDSANILPNSFDHIIEEWSDNDQDYEAMKLLPKKYKDHCIINYIWK
ncbi:hypothetical protein RhiirC2_779388 [Rhizophagus irregularis]|uniref:Uncharacterized protein n=1 Tax=Rhizophagus irregularis TaxID=588596 RepID=A0A2N1NA06_9GLOM|nr:hypothetical protein RhiirC2_779388 [Rhizophagus irregularis]